MGGLHASLRLLRSCRGSRARAHPRGYREVPWMAHRAGGRHRIRSGRPPGGSA
ncbi:hypothetical protein FM110_00080 [Brachybacterium nesterenkovii]|uniref:Uncharacterized protein n=1 Tax=Brachybacterium nesterenkovii TaxID=47847 RepID=A0A1X6WSN0_9MICO|nr:hypothetical protein FM110_00080 [Brachybacterium nesterenkovii]